MRQRAQGDPQGTRNPAKLSVSFTSRRGKSKLLISVFAADGRLLPRSPLMIRDGDDFLQAWTGPDGTLALAYETEATEAVRAFEVRGADQLAALLGISTGDTRSR